MNHAAIMLIAVAIDLAVGWPAALYARVGHPVTWIGAAIGWLDEHLNRGQGRRAKGVLAALAVILGVTGAAVAVQALLPAGWIGAVLAGILAWPFLAVRSMHAHVRAVARPLEAGDLPAARRAVSMIVGRDTTNLDEAAVTRAALESLAENTADGIVAPLFWGLVAGLPGIAAYKAINTLDSMVGHRTARHEAFGWASARIDDVANLIPARLTALLFALAGGRIRAVLACTLADAHLHRSPNAGWPEAAVAASLGVRLSGPRIYNGEPTNQPWVNGGARDCTARDIARGLALYRRTMALTVALTALLALLW